MPPSNLPVQGNPGRGFAVAANEVKEVGEPDHTGNGSEFKTTSRSFKEDTEKTVRRIERVHQIIEEFNKISEVIANSVHEQNQVVQDIHQSISAAEQETVQISEGIQLVDQKVSQTANDADVSKRVADSMTLIASELDQGVNQFKIAEGNNGKSKEKLSAA